MPGDSPEPSVNLNSIPSNPISRPTHIGMASDSMFIDWPSVAIWDSMGMAMLCSLTPTTSSTLPTNVHAEDCEARSNRSAMVALDPTLITVLGMRMVGPRLAETTANISKQSQRSKGITKHQNGTNGDTTGAAHASHLGDCCPSAYSSGVSYVKKRRMILH